MAANYKSDKKRTHIAIRTRVEDAPMVGTLLPHPVLQYSLLPTLPHAMRTRSDLNRLGIPCEAMDPKAVAIYDSLYSFSSTTIVFSFSKP
jgi:hypothetical protein